MLDYCVLVDILRQFPYNDITHIWPVGSTFECIYVSINVYIPLCQRLCYSRQFYTDDSKYQQGTTSTWMHISWSLRAHHKNNGRVSGQMHTVEIVINFSWAWWGIVGNEAPKTLAKALSFPMFQTPADCLLSDVSHQDLTSNSITTNSSQTKSARHPPSLPERYEVKPT